MIPILFLAAAAVLSLLSLRNGLNDRPWFEVPSDPRGFRPGL